jgi:hypothetical protein
VLIYGLTDHLDCIGSFQLVGQQGMIPIETCPEKVGQKLRELMVKRSIFYALHSIARLDQEEADQETQVRLYAL